MPALLGVEPLDRLLGAVPKGARILMRCAPDVDGRTALVQAAAHALAADREVVYVVTDRPPSGVRRSLAKMGVPDATGVRFVDAYSGLLAAAGDPSVHDPADLVQVVASIAQAAGEDPNRLVCIESLSSLLDKAGAADFERAMPALTQALRGVAASISLFMDWPYPGQLDRALKGFDADVRLYGVEEGIVRNQALRIERAVWLRKVDRPPALVTITAGVGLRFLVPKVVITGPTEAGKTTMVRALSGAAVGTERMGTTVALDKGRYEDDGMVAELFGTPGGERFEPLIRNILDQAAAAILVVDASDPTSFPRALEMLAQMRKRGLHVLVAANKQDVVGALSPEEVAKQLDADAVGCTLRDKDSARLVMRTLMQQILQEPRQ